MGAAMTDRRIAVKLVALASLTGLALLLVAAAFWIYLSRTAPVVPITATGQVIRFCMDKCAVDQFITLAQQDTLMTSILAGALLVIVGSTGLAVLVALGGLREEDASHLSVLVRHASKMAHRVRLLPRPESSTWERAFRWLKGLLSVLYALLGLAVLGIGAYDLWDGTDTKSVVTTVLGAVLLAHAYYVWRGGAVGTTF